MSEMKQPVYPVYTCPRGDAQELILYLFLSTDMKRYQNEKKFLKETYPLHPYHPSSTLPVRKPLPSTCLHKQPALFVPVSKTSYHI